MPAFLLVVDAILMLRTGIVFVFRGLMDGLITLAMLVSSENPNVFINEVVVIVLQILTVTACRQASPATTFPFGTRWGYISAKS